MNYFMERVLDEALLRGVERLRPVAAECGLSMTELALAWVLREPNLASAIIGASRPEQVVENAGASGIKLDEETLRAVDTALADCYTR
jgi:aryl-alcohol dehydrogenase-like predicted oxidoreductase